MIIIYPNSPNGNANGYVIRPIPFVSISYNVNKNKSASLGGTYDIVLNGTILDNVGSPIAVANGKATFHTSTSDVPAATGVNPLAAILQKQEALRNLFNQDGMRVEILDSQGNNPVCIFYPTLESINFEEGIYLNSCKYTINLSAPFLFDKNNNIAGGSVFDNRDISGIYPANASGYSDYYFVGSGKTLSAHISSIGGVVEDFSENWSIEPEDGNGNTLDPFTSRYNTTRVYRLTRNLSATGKTFFADSKKYEGWVQARGFVHNRLSNNKYPIATFASGILNLDTYSNFNHSSTENIDRTAGTYNLTDSWILSSGSAHENYTASASTTNQTNIVTVSIDGNIKGLSSMPASGFQYNASAATGTFNTSFENAISQYRKVSGNGKFGLDSWVYKRAQNIVGVALHPTPLSVTVGTNEFTGEVTYNVEYDSRPLNFISGVISENITIQDTYPGDVFSIIPVIGRVTGPILQYIGGRTEYQRNVSLEIIVSGQYGAQGNIRDQIVRSKPSLNEDTRSSIIRFIRDVSPAQEPGIRKYFLNPPVETWDPKEKRYSINLNWVYELDN